jgi:nucleotide-binding universal stress UspA family protein
MIRFETFLVPLDFSRHSEKALDHALVLAQIFGARIHLLHACHLSIFTTPDHVIYGDLARALQRGASQKLDKARDKVTAAGVEVEIHLVELPPAEAVAETAKKIGADLIVMGTRGLTGFKHVLLGSVADRTIRSVPCPVMTVKRAVRATGSSTPHTILVPTDFSDGSRRAVDLACALAKGVEAAHLVLIHAYSLPQEVKTLTEVDHEPLLKTISERATEDLERVLVQLKDQGISAELTVQHGSPEAVVMDVATEREADLIVMGTHGRTGLGDHGQGQVGERAESRREGGGASIRSKLQLLARVLLRIFGLKILCLPVQQTKTTTLTARTRVTWTPVRGGLRRVAHVPEVEVVRDSRI